jgi:phosphoglycerate dehydrogenase-like enzyme
MAPRIIVVPPSAETGAIAREMAPAGFELVLARGGGAELEAALGPAEYMVCYPNVAMHDPFYRAAPRLKLVQLLSAGYDAVDLEAARRAKVPVSNNGGANAISVAENAIMLMLTVARKVVWQHANVSGGRWRGNGPAPRMYELFDKTLGIVGLGTIGKKVARLAQAFGMRVQYYDIARLPEHEEDAFGVKFRLFRELLASSDIMTMHVPLNDSTRHMIGAPELALMKPGAILVNTARGPVVDLGINLRSGRRLSGGRNHATRAALVVGEVALAVMLLVSAGLVAKSLMRLLSVDAGFDPTHLLTLQVNSSGTNYRKDAAIFAHHDRVREVVGALPGVTSVTLTNQLPLGGNVDMYGVIDPENIPSNPELVPSGDRYVVPPGYFATMRIPILRGRAFTGADAADTSNKVVLVSAALAQRMWPGANPLGKRIRVGGVKAPDRVVIGVTGNVHHRGLDAATTLQWYAPEHQWLDADNQVVLVVRTAGDPAAIAPTVRKTLASIDATQPIINVATMDQVIATSTTQRRLALVLFGAFIAAAPVSLACSDLNTPIYFNGPETLELTGQEMVPRIMNTVTLRFRRPSMDEQKALDHSSAMLVGHPLRLCSRTRVQRGVPGRPGG